MKTEIAIIKDGKVSAKMARYPREDESPIAPSRFS